MAYNATCSDICASYLPIFITLIPVLTFVYAFSSAYTIMCNRRVPVDICVKMSVPAARDHLPRGDTLALNRQCPLVAGTTVLLSFRTTASFDMRMFVLQCKQLF